MSENPENRIPEQEAGTAVNVEDSVSLPDMQEARKFFQQVKNRLLHVNDWHAFAGSLSAEFQLVDPAGNPIDRLPQKDDYFRINIPAPGIQTGDGFDWVKVEEIVERAEGDDEFTSLRVRPASSPLNDHPNVAHFYTDEATSNFIVKRKGCDITAGVYGRNEKPNVKAAENLLDKVRNAIVGTGSVSGFSKIQWKALVSGLLAKED